MKQQKKPRHTKTAGSIESFSSGVATVRGLSGAMLHETLVRRDDKPVAIVVGFTRDLVEALFFDEAFPLDELVYTTGELFSFPISKTVPGRILSGFGEPLDEFGAVRGGKRQPAFRTAPQIIDREPVADPLTTGIKIIDTVLPIGRGQRELIVGDRKLGKSTLALDAVLHQKHATKIIYCIYVICGQKEQKLREVVTLFEEYNATLYTVIVAAPAGVSFAEQYLAPFVGCAIGEYFRDAGYDALVVYDDLSKHAKTYRDIALLLARPPGRESYPGDIFSLHAGLLERAAKLSKKKGGGSLTALPIVETQEGDITSYIPTNIISITDGQIYLERGLYQRGFLPAVNAGLSVSRLGSQVQPDALSSVTGGIRLALAQHKELQKLAQLETVTSEEAKRKISRGELLLELLKQDKHALIDWPEQVVLFFSVEEGLFDIIPAAQWTQFEQLFLEMMRCRAYKIAERIRHGGLDPDIKDEIRDMVSEFKREFIEKQ